MATFKHSLHVDLAGNLSRRARQYQRDLSRFTGSGRRQFALLSRASATADRGAALLANRFTALASGAAGAGAARYVSGLERRFTRLGIQGNRTAEEMEKVKSEIFDVANAPGIRIDPSELVAGVEQIIEKTGDLDLARDNLRNIAMVVQAAGAAGRDAGALIADLQEKFGLKNKDEFLHALDALVRQGKAGAFTLQNLATQGNRVSAAYATTGRTGAAAAREMGAVLQVIRRGAGSAEQAATGLQALLRDLNDAEKLKMFQRNGIQIFDPDNPKVMRSVATLMKEIVTTAGGDSRKLRGVFSDEAFNALSGAIAEFNQKGTIESLDRYLSIQGDGKQLTEDSARAAGDAAAAWRSLTTEAQRFADLNLAGPMKEMVAAFNELDPKTREWLMKGAAGAVGAGVAWKVGRAGVRGAATVLRGSQKAAKALARRGPAASALALTTAGAAALDGTAETTGRGADIGRVVGGVAGGFVGVPGGPVGIAGGGLIGSEIGANVGAQIEKALQGIEHREQAARGGERTDRMEVDINLRGDVPSGTEVSTRSNRPDGRIRVNRMNHGPATFQGGR